MTGILLISGIALWNSGIGIIPERVQKGGKFIIAVMISRLQLFCCSKVTVVDICIVSNLKVLKSNLLSYEEASMLGESWWIVRKEGWMEKSLLR